MFVAGKLPESLFKITVGNSCRNETNISFYAVGIEDLVKMVLPNILVDSRKAVTNDLLLKIPSVLDAPSMRDCRQPPEY